jgi:hypothetical protein
MTQKTLKVIDALRAMYPHPASAIIFEFRGGTGWARESRADAIAMNLWPSEGLELIGFEIKTSPQDWLRELKNPDKCEPMKQFCDKWYLVVDDVSIVRRWDSDELPKDWGMMAMNYMGKLEVKKEAPKLTPFPPDRLFLASLMRLAADPLDEVVIDGRKYIATK